MNSVSNPAAMRRLPVAVLFNSYPLLLDVLEPSLRGAVEIAGRATTIADAALLIDAHQPDLLVAGSRQPPGPRTSSSWCATRSTSSLR